MKPWFKSRKVWVAIVSALSTIAAHIYGKPDIAEKLLVIGTILIGSFGLEDHGKAKASLEAPDYEEDDEE